jgi:hypothetical protein
MTDTIETTENVFEAKARSIVGTCIPKMAYDSYLDGDYDVLVSAIAAALEAERLEERRECAKIAKEFAEEFDDASAEACVAMEIHTEIEARNQATCNHEWIDARNEIVQSGEYCSKCFMLRAGNEAAAIRSRETDNG